MLNGKKKSNKALDDNTLRITQCELGYKEIFTGSTLVKDKESQEIKNDGFILNRIVCDIFDKDDNVVSWKFAQN